MIVNIYKGEMLQRCQDNYTWIYQAHKSTEMFTAPRLASHVLLSYSGADNIVGIPMGGFTL